MTAPLARPLLRYHGGKWRIAPWLIEHFPPHRVYVEPFGGAGSVLLRKPRSDFEVYNDLGADVVNVFRVLRDREQAAELKRRLDLTPWARVEFLEAYEFSEDPVERARRTIVRCFMGHGTTSQRKHRTGFRAGSHPNRAGGGHGDWRGYRETLPAFTERLQGIVVEQKDARAVIDRYDAPDALIYVDPPYVMSTRSSMRGDGDIGRAYAYEMDEDDHRRLAVRLCRAQAAVVVSGYASRLYDDELYVGWERDERRTRSDAAQSRVEVVWVKPAGVLLERPQTLRQAALFEEEA